MSIRPSIPVVEQPALTLEHWRVFLAAGNCHVVAWCVENEDGRVTSPVDKFDAARRLAITKSGRIYKLSGPPGDNGDADYTWQRWKHLLRIQEVRDVTNDVLRTIQRDVSGMH